MIFKKGELKLLWPFYLDAFLSPILFFVPAFWVIYLAGLNFSFLQIGILMAVFPLAALLFEIPTGAVADLYGRKFSVILGLFLEMFAFLAVYFFTDFYPLLFIFAFMGFASTFSSGANEAWVTDLINHKRKNFLHGYFVKSQSFDSLALFFSGLLGALFVKLYGLDVIWLVAGFSYLVSIVILMFGVEHFRKCKSGFFKSFKKIKSQSKTSISYARKHPVLFYFLLASGAFVFAVNFNAGLTWTPFMKELGFPDHAFGYMWSAMFFVSFLATSISGKFNFKNKEKSFIMWSILLWIVFSLGVIFVKTLAFAFVILLGCVLFDTVKRPFRRVYFHRFVPTKLRATVGSVETMWYGVIAIIVAPIVGYSIDLLGPQVTIFFGGILAVPSLIIYSKINDVKKRDK